MAESYLNRGVACFKKGDYVQAIANVDAYFFRGRAYYNLKDKDRAVADFRKVLELQLDGGSRQKAMDYLRLLGVKP